MGACCCCFPVYKPARENPMRSTRESLIQHKPRPTTPYHPPPPPFITYTDKVDFPFSLSGMNAVERFKTGFENFRNTIYEYFSDALRVRRKRPELFERLKTGQSPKNQLDEIAKNLTSMAAQISDLARKMSTLEPLVPLAAKLDKLPDRVTQVQASAFEYSEQVRALNLAVERVEASQRAATTNPSGLVSRQPRDNTPPQDDADARSRRDQHGDDTAIDNSFLPRAKLEFPTYDGKGDPLPWLNRCETFRGQKTPETRKVWYASLHLIGDAQLWYYRIELNSGEPSWRRFVQLVHTRFGPPMTDSPLGELTALRRTGTVENYVNSFLALACRDVELSESQQVQLFTAGLVNPLKTDVALCRPRSLDDAIMLARAYEQRATLGPTDPSAPRTGRVPRPSLPASSAASASASTTSADVAASTAAGKQPLVSALPRKRLSPAEMAQRRSEGLCYNCDEKYVAGHRCKKSFVIEVISFPEDTGDEEDSTPEAHAITLDEPSIFLHALAGISAPKFNTIKYMVFSCADSRVCPTLTFGLQPGEAFTVRNIASMVPAYDKRGQCSIGSAIEYAVVVLKVECIIVIGHSCCGGIKELLSLKEDRPNTFHFVDDWVKIGLAAKKKVERENMLLPFDDQCTVLEKEEADAVGYRVQRSSKPRRNEAPDFDHCLRGRVDADYQIHTEGIPVIVHWRRRENIFN
ncbi:hypothetical protein OsJ_02776 [Oryza sativa Japonica Group]|uniref:carbonic anhydrase n=1 Tax=Oryza sativa subsp. japonica TaxID=39947 RepID=B9EY99_ORYSJ|nr:hypothetical protein OsJ_02776 [Oryza sativa Japonica Group]